MGTFSKWVRTLIENGLLEERYYPDQYKRKLLSITHDGMFTLKFSEMEIRRPDLMVSKKKRAIL